MPLVLLEHFALFIFLVGVVAEAIEVCNWQREHPETQDQAETQTATFPFPTPTQNQLTSQVGSAADSVPLLPV